MYWIPLTLLCALSLAAADAVTKRWLGGLGARDLTVVRLGLAGIVTFPLLLADPPAWPPSAFWGWISWLIPLELLALVLYVQAIRDHSLSLTLPYLAFTPAFITLTGWLILGERLSAGGFIGIALVVAGSWLLHLESWSATSWRRAVTAPFSHPGSRRMLAVALIYALTSVGGKAAMQYMDADQFGPFYILLVGMGALVLFRGWERLPRVIGLHPVGAVATASLMGVMIVTHFLALQQVETAYMIALKRTSLLFGIVFGVLWLGEPKLRQKLLAGSIMLAGVAVITVV